MAAGLTSLLNIARDALSAQSFGVTVTGQNITNANTVGYARREALLETRAVSDQTYGGVAIQGLRRVTDVHVEREQLLTSGQQSASAERDRQLTSIEALLNDATGTGLGAQLDKVFSSFAALAARPNDPTVRATVLDAANSFASDAHSIADELASTRGRLLQRAEDVAEQVNSQAQEVANLNRQISQAELQGKDAADLKDRRSQVLLDLAQLIDTRTTLDGSGNVLVHSAGAVLVEGSTARSLSVELGEGGQLRFLVARNGGSGPRDVTQQLSGGVLAGIRETRDVDIFAVANRLDEFVFDVATAINSQHALGYGQDGGTGRNLFDLSATSQGAARSLTLSADVAGNPDAVAAALSFGSLPGGSDNAAALAALLDTPLGASGRIPTESYADLVADVGLRKSSAERDLAMREAIHAQTQAMRESISGVSLDEEMVNLMKFQRAYDAAARVLSTVDEMLQELLNRVGR